MFCDKYLEKAVSVVLVHLGSSNTILFHIINMILLFLLLLLALCEVFLCHCADITKYLRLGNL